MKKFLTKLANGVGIALARVRVKLAMQLGVFGDFPDAHAVGFSDTIPKENGVGTLRATNPEDGTTLWLTVVAANPAVIRNPTAGAVRDVFTQAQKIGLTPSELHIRIPEGRMEMYSPSMVGL